MVRANRSLINILVLNSMLGLAVGAEPDREVAKVLDGKPKVLVVNGYSTSFQWPKILQGKLDKYFEKRIIEVKSATRGGTPIAKWINITTGQPRPPWNRVLRPALQRDDRRPRIVLAQQSLQWVFGNRTEGIRSAADVARINRGADALQKYAELLLRDGADRVFIAMHIYKRPMEPEIGNERLALAELMKRKLKNVHAGPDVWEPTRKLYPQAFARDRLHPNRMGAEVMAQMWFESLLSFDGLAVPEWSRQEMEDAPRGETRSLRGRGSRPAEPRAV